MAIIGFQNEKDVVEEINALLEKNVTLFSVVTVAGSVSSKAAEIIGAPVIYVRDFNEIKRYADWWLIKKSGMPEQDFRNLIMWLKQNERHGKTIP